VTSAGRLRAVAAGLAAATALSACGHSSPAPALSATGPKAFTYDIVHRNFAGDGFAKADQPRLLALGQALCGALDKGRTVAQVNAGLVATKSLTATPAEDGQLLLTAVAALCPKYVAAITAAAGPTPKAASH
jgi:hypothetical protein